jgi:mannan endo-1,4-beta-mannosidase
MSWNGTQWLRDDARPEPQPHPGRRRPVRDAVGSAVMGLVIVGLLVPSTVTLASSMSLRALLPHWRAQADVAVYQETDPELNYRGAWSAVSSKDYLGGMARSTDDFSARVILRFRGTGVSWIGPTGPTAGTARVYVDGELVRTMNLWSASFRPTRVLFQTTWDWVGTHRIRVVGLGTSGHPSVAVDAFIVRLNTSAVSALVDDHGAPIGTLLPGARDTPADPSATPTGPVATTDDPSREGSAKAAPSSPTKPRLSPTPPPLSAGSDLVKRSGRTLTLGGQPYRFTGMNIYMAASGGTPASCGGSLYPDVEVPLSRMPNGTAFRFWAFQNFFVSNGVFDWTNLDHVVSVAAAHGDKIIPVLANQLDYCDSAKDLVWYESGYKSKIERGNLVTYRDYVSAIVGRYAGDPTIAMWQMVNEGEARSADGTCDEPAASAALLAFSDDVGGIAHRLDPDHAVSLGVLAGWAGNGQGQWCGASNDDYQALMASPGNDVCDYHDYGFPADPMGRPSAPNLASAIQMCQAVGRPIMVGETGIYATSSIDLAPRAARFGAKFAAQFRAGVVGELMWCWAVKSNYVLPAQDPDYGIFPGDPSLGVLGSP